MSYNPPTDALDLVIKSPKVRKLIYSIYAVIAIVVGATVVAFGTQGDLPAWLEVSQAVIAYLAVPIGGLAAVNTNRPTTTDVAETKETTGLSGR